MRKGNEDGLGTVKCWRRVLCVPYYCHSQRQPVVAETKGSSRRAELKSWLSLSICVQVLCLTTAQGVEETECLTVERRELMLMSECSKLSLGGSLTGLSAQGLHTGYMCSTPPRPHRPPNPGWVLLVDSVVITFPICSDFLDQVAIKRQEVWYPTMKPRICVVLLVKVIPCNPWFWIPPLCAFYHFYEERDVICVASAGLCWEVSWFKALHFRLLIKISRALFLHSTW